MAPIDWLNDNEGAATVLLTALLVALTVLSAAHARRAIAAAREANDISRRGQLGALLVLTGGSYSSGERKLRFTVSNIGPAPAVRLNAILRIGAAEYPAENSGVQLGGRATKEGDPPTARVVSFTVPPEVLGLERRIPAGTTVYFVYRDPFGRQEQVLENPGESLIDGDHVPVSLF